MSLKHTHEEETRTQGWSRWGVLAIGADHTVIPLIGEALLPVAESREEEEVAQVFLLQKDIDLLDFDTLEEEREFFLNNCDKMMKACSYASRNYEKFTNLKTVNGFSPLQVLGEALIYFGENTIGYPIDYEFSHDQPYDDWRNDCIKYGQVFKTRSVEFYPEAFLWLGENFYSLWD